MHVFTQHQAHSALSHSLEEVLIEQSVYRQQSVVTRPKLDWISWTATDKCNAVAGTAVKNRIGGPLSLVQQESHSTKEDCVQQALDLNLARALMLSSCSTEAVGKFKQLEASGGLSWLYANDCCLIPIHLFKILLACKCLCVILKYGCLTVDLGNGHSCRTDLCF